MPKKSWLEIAEIAALATSVVGTVAAAISSQVAYAAAPLTVTISLNLLNRYRFEQRKEDYTTSAIYDVHRVVESLHQQMHKRQYSGGDNSSLEAEIASIYSQLQALEYKIHPLVGELVQRTQMPDFQAIEAELRDLKEKLQTLDIINPLVSEVKQVQSEKAMTTRAIAQLRNQLDLLAKRLDNLPTDNCLTTPAKEVAFAGTNGHHEELETPANVDLVSESVSGSDFSAESSSNDDYLFEKATKIKVIGVGGCGCKAIARIKANGLTELEFWAISSDVEELNNSTASHVLQIGENNAGDPETSKQAARSSREEIAQILAETDLVFIIAGMGKGTGTGATPVIGEIARKIGCLTVAIVTRPLTIDGSRATRLADEAIATLATNVDSLIAIPNNKLLAAISEQSPVEQAYQLANDIIAQGVQSLSEMLAVPSLVNVDFADLRLAMARSGTALMGIGSGMGQNRAREAAIAAIFSPLLDASLEKATTVILTISGGSDLSLHEVNTAAEVVREAIAPNARLIVGATMDLKMQSEVRVTAIATGLKNSGLHSLHNHS
ncbi:cell division protein FtsZ [Oscillatoria salina]|uniref:cell division protein FtsZ n=1 Tax=Oscillatoria salina TaxID=331517 RepID=UPI0013B778D9|nr:cell division protein FtsZ [Oscillatoria salina]MBZ8180726.1 cell division protein FtsZ [Oscillatoria salina IIICB1]NET87593.1 cell division protein FtsZ [Kamptonema sp. SIO1D9]